MAKHEPKVYTRICAVYGTDFVGFKMPIGAVYGRAGNTFYVSLYRTIKRGQMAVFVKESDQDWSKKLLPASAEICRAILKCVDGQAVEVGAFRNPDCKRMHKRKSAPAPKMERVIAGGKSYRALPYEMALPDRVGSRDLKGLDAPKLRGVCADFNARMRPDRATYGVDFRGMKYLFRGTEEAETFCRQNKISFKEIKQEFVYNEANEVAYNQKTPYAYWANLDSATSGNAGTVAHNIKGWRD